MMRVLIAAALLGGPVFGWQYFHREDLKRTIRDQVDKQVFVVDLGIKIWENDSDRSPNRMKLPIAQFVRFDTEHFTCVIPDANSAAIELVRRTLRESRDVKKSDGKFNYDRRPAYLAIKGTVMQAEIWGRRKQGNNPWYVIVVDEIETPRERYFVDEYYDRHPRP